MQICASFLATIPSQTNDGSRILRVKTMINFTHTIQSHNYIQNRILE